MDTSRFSWERAAFACAFGSALATLISIAASQILLGAGLAALLIGRQKLRLPPIAWPLGLFILATLVSLAFSPDPWGGRAQVRKLFVYTILVLLASTFSEVRQARWLAIAWTAAATASAILGFVQYAQKYDYAERMRIDFYLAYVADRITGFMSHWMTFSGMQMVVLMFAVCLILFAAGDWRLKAALGAGCVLIAASIVLAGTRGVWIAAFVAGVFLLWNWRRSSVLLLPVALGLVWLAGPESVRQRMASIARPHGETDSNQHRIVTWRTGLEMIKAHPVLGLGPEMVGRDFLKYVPADIPRPLPQGWYGHLHNIYLQFAAERGIPALAMLLWLLGKALWDWSAALVRLPAQHEARWLLVASLAALIGLMVTGIFEHNLGDSEVLLLFFSVIVMGYLGAAQAPSRR